MTPTNLAAWLTARRSPLEVGPAPYTHPGPNEIVVRNRAIAINPVDWTIQLVGGPIYPWIKTPTVLGSDVAGEVAEIGDGVTRFAVGDRVLGHAIGTEKSHNRAAEGAFQHYPVLFEDLTSPIPDELAYEQAAALPLALSTAACGLFQRAQLGLPHPTTALSSDGRTLVVWGGASSVGVNAIQLARAAGCAVLTTCSPHNDELMRSLGAERSFDYRSPTVVGELAAALRDRPVAGAIALGPGSTLPCIEILSRCEGNRFVAQAAGPVPLADVAGHPRHLPGFMLRYAAGSARVQLSARVKRVQTRFIWGGSLKDDEVGPAIYRAYLPQALADDRYTAAPTPEVVGHDLTAVQAALETQRAGVSARKIVVTLDP